MPLSHATLAIICMFCENYLKEMQTSWIICGWCDVFSALLRHIVLSEQNTLTNEMKWKEKCIRTFIQPTNKRMSERTNERAAKTQQNQWLSTKININSLRRLNLILAIYTHANRICRFSQHSGMDGPKWHPKNIAMHFQVRFNRIAVLKCARSQYIYEQQKKQHSKLISSIHSMTVTC